MATCPNCDGEGTIITCCDDLCVGGHHCIHGDGEEMCPECYGDGEIDDFDDDDGDDGQEPSLTQTRCR